MCRKSILGRCALTLTCVLSTFACGTSSPPAAPQESEPSSISNIVREADRCIGQRRFLGTGPGTPLAIVDEHGLRSAGQPCCEAFADREATWFALDAYGRSKGTAHVTHAELYEVSGCFELDLSGPAGVFRDNMIDHFTIDTVFGFASSVPRAGRQWQPSELQLAALETWVQTMRAPLGIEANPIPLAERTLFFEERDPYLGERGNEMVRYAVIGGRALIIARLDGEGFVLSHLENDLTHSGVAHDRMYLPAAAFDFGGDEGETEIVFRWNEAPAWKLRVLSRRFGAADGWEIRAEDIGGATI